MWHFKLTWIIAGHCGSQVGRTSGLKDTDHSCILSYQAPHPSLSVWPRQPLQLSIFSVFSVLESLWPAFFFPWQAWWIPLWPLSRGSRSLHVTLGTLAVHHSAFAQTVASASNVCPCPHFSLHHLITAMSSPPTPDLSSEVTASEKPALTSPVSRPRLTCSVALQPWVSLPDSQCSL